jgi:hypothetical protein
MARAKRILQMIGVLFLLYLASYPLLRVCHVLVRRDYTVYVRDDTHLIFVECIDIGHGPAFDHDKARFDSTLGTLYAPAGVVELRLRGYSPKPKVWSGDDVCAQ